MAPSLIFDLQPLSPLSASLNLTLFIPKLCIEDHLWCLFREEMWTSRQSRRIKEGRNVGSYLLDGLRSTLFTFKLCVNLFGHCRERLISWFPWRREWTINTLKIRENFGNYEMLLLLTTKLPWYMSHGLKFHFIFSSYTELELSLQEELQVVFPLVYLNIPNSNPVTILRHVRRRQRVNKEAEWKDANPSSAGSFCSVRPTTCKTQTTSPSWAGRTWSSQPATCRGSFSVEGTDTQHSNFWNL